MTDKLAGMTDDHFLDRMSQIGQEQRTWPPMGLSPESAQRLWDLTHITMERPQFSDDLPVIRNADGSINHFASNSLRSDPSLSHPSDPEFIDIGGEQEIVQISGVPPGAEFKKKLADREHKSAFGKSAEETIPTEFHMGDVEPNSPEDNWTEYVHSGKAWARSDKYPTPGHYQAAVVNGVIAMTSGFRRLWETR